MKEKEELDAILTAAYKRMHRYTCAEATLQAFLELWDMPINNASWATGGYMGAISSGQTTCGLLIGTSVAIGMRVGQGLEKIPENEPNKRDKAISLVNRIYRKFIKQFGTSQCNKLTNGFKDKDWMKQCDTCLQHVFDNVVLLTAKGKL